MEEVSSSPGGKLPRCTNGRHHLVRKRAARVPSPWGEAVVLTDEGDLIGLSTVLKGEWWVR